METYATAIQHLQESGAVVAASQLEHCMTKERRRQRQMQQESPAVAEAFLRLRKAEDQENVMRLRIADQHRDRKRDAAKALADRDAARAEIRETRRKIAEMESICASKHAIKTLSLIHI